MSAARPTEALCHESRLLPRLNRSLFRQREDEDGGDPHPVSSLDSEVAAQLFHARVMIRVRERVYDAAALEDVVAVGNAGRKTEIPTFRPRRSSL